MEKMPERMDSVEQGTNLPQLDVGMRLEVMTTENKLIFVGQIEWIKGDAIQIVDATGGDLPYIQYNSPIKLRGFYHSSALFLEGQIGGSSRKFWRIDRLRTLQTKEQRGYFRQNISRKARVMCLNEIFGGQKAGNDRKKVPMDCEVANISATGVMLLSKGEYQVGDWLWLMDFVLEPGEKPLAMTCTVRRVVVHDENIEYGCEFYNLDKAEQEQLIQSIVVLQKKEWKQRREDRE